MPLALLLSIFPLQPAHAAPACTPGAAQVLAAGPSGPYDLTVAVRPPDPGAGELQLVAGVCDAAGDPVRGASVRFIPTSPDGRRGAEILAFERQFPGEYTADLTVRQLGEWRYQVLVSSPLGGAQTDVAFTVHGPAETDFLPTLVFLLVSAVVLGGTIYLVYRGRGRTATI